MNILYISYDGATDPLGQSQVIPYLRKISSTKIKFILETFDKKEILRNRDLRSKTKSYLEGSGIKWKVLKYHKSPALLSTLYDVLIGFLFGLYWVRQNSVEIIHARSYVASTIAFFIKKLTGCKFIFDMRGFWPEERVDGGIWKKDSLIYKIAKFFEKKFISDSDAIIVLSDKAKEILEQDYSLCVMKKRIVVIPTCVDTELFHIKDNIDKSSLFAADKFVFIYLGSLGTWYCLYEMISFFKIAKKKIDNAYFILLLSHIDKNIGRLMKDNNLTNEDFLIKSVYREEVPYWLNIANVSVSFIKPVFSKRASCPTKFGESLACGTPVVINSGIGDTEKVVNNEKIGVVIKEFCEENYALKLDELRLLFKDKDNLRQRCRLAAEKYFSLEYGVKKYLNVYNNLAK